MAIFGTQSPRFEASDTTVVDIDYASDIRIEQEYVDIVHENQINGERVIINRGCHITFSLIDHLHYYGAPNTKYNTYNSYKYDVTNKLYWHRDNQEFRDSSNVAVPFVLMEVTHVRLTDKISYEDAVFLKFISTKFVDIQKSTVSLP